MEQNDLKQCVWSVETEDLINRWLEKANYYKLLYEQSAQHYYSLDKWFGLPVDLLSVVIASSLFIQLDQCVFWQHVLSGIGVLILTALRTIEKKIKIQ